MTDPLSQREQPDPVDTSDAVVRAEEELSISTHRRATHRARLAKRIETRDKTVTRTVFLRREEVEIEYLPNRSDLELRDASGSRPAERWLVLFEEEVVVMTRWVARERVRLAVHTVTEDREISALVRREQIAIDDGRGPAAELTSERDATTDNPSTDPTRENTNG